MNHIILLKAKRYYPRAIGGPSNRDLSLQKKMKFYHIFNKRAHLNSLCFSTVRIKLSKHLLVARYEDKRVKN